MVFCYNGPNALRLGPFQHKALHRICAHESSPVWNSFYQHHCSFSASIAVPLFIDLFMLRCLGPQALPSVLFTLKLSMQWISKLYIQARLFSRILNAYYIQVLTTPLHLAVQKTIQVQCLNTSSQVQRLVSPSYLLLLQLCTSHWLHHQSSSISEPKENTKVFYISFYLKSISNRKIWLNSLLLALASSTYSQQSSQNDSQKASCIWNHSSKVWHDSHLSWSLKSP